MKYQVVSYTKDGYIIRFKVFPDGDYYELSAYIIHQTQLKEVSRVEITRWNTKGDRE